MTQDKYLSIVRHYEDCLSRHGDNHKGVDWPNLSDALKRYQVMLDLIRSGGDTKIILDFGCGASHFYEYMLSSGRDDLKYVGLEISEDFYKLSKAKYKNNNYIFGDILKNPEILPNVDYVIMNGVFTEKLNLSFEEMEAYFHKMIVSVFDKANIGIAFNLMSISVDWQRDDLFHYPLDRLSNFLCKNISRNFIVRNDYGLYEYTVYIYR
jgi:SAM-dependent methyltransferase